MIVKSVSFAVTVVSRDPRAAVKSASLMSSGGSSELRQRKEVVELWQKFNEQRPPSQLKASNRCCKSPRISNDHQCTGPRIQKHRNSKRAGLSTRRLEPVKACRGPQSTLHLTRLEMSRDSSSPSRRKRRSRKMTIKKRSWTT